MCWSHWSSGPWGHWSSRQRNKSTSLSLLPLFSDYLDDLHCFDPATNLWTLNLATGDSARPSARLGHGFSSVGDKLYVHGGLGYDGLSPSPIPHPPSPEAPSLFFSSSPLPTPPSLADILSACYLSLSNLYVSRPLETPSSPRPPPPHCVVNHLA